MVHMRRDLWLLNGKTQTVKCRAVVRSTFILFSMKLPFFLSVFHQRLSLFSSRQSCATSKQVVGQTLLKVKRDSYFSVRVDAQPTPSA